MKTGCLIIARTGSRRLPGKALLPLGNKPVLSVLVERMRQARSIDAIILCTSVLPADDLLEQWALEEGVHCVRGHADDVLARMHQAAQLHNLDYIIHTGGDCPFTDPFFCDAMVAQFSQTQADLITALHLPTGMFPYGIKPSALEKVMAIKNSTDTAAWGKYFTETGMFSVEPLRTQVMHNRPDIRLTIDYKEDYEVAQQLYDGLFAQGKSIQPEDIILWMDNHPAVRTHNEHCAALYLAEWSRQSPLKLKPGYRPATQSSFAHAHA